MRVRTTGPGFVEHGVSVEFDHYMALPVVLTLGAIPQHQSSGKMHALLGLGGNTPIFIHASDRKMHNVQVIELMRPEAAEIYDMDSMFSRQLN